MSDAPREIRDILAECMRRERLGLMRPLWHDAVRIDNDSCEQIRRRADHLLRLLRDYGLSVVRSGESVASPPSPEETTIYRYPIVGRQAERLIRCDGNNWSIATSERGIETKEQEFTLPRAIMNVGLVLTDAPEAKAISGLGRQLAATTEIYRMHAHGMGTP